MDMVDILCKNTEPFEQIVNISLTECPMQNSHGVSADKLFKDYTILHM